MGHEKPEPGATLSIQCFPLAKQRYTDATNEFFFLCQHLNKPHTTFGTDVFSPLVSPHA